MKKQPRNIILLGLTSLFNDLSSEMIMPILPFLIMAFGGNAVIVGLVGGLRGSISNLLKVFCGFWSDKTGKRKIFVSSGYSISIFFKLALAFARTWQGVLLFAGLERVGKGLRTAPRDAIIADSMPNKKGTGFGIHRAFDTAGAVFGSIIAFLLFWGLGFDFKTIILIAAAIGLISLIPLIFVKAKKETPKPIFLKTSLKNMSLPFKLFLMISGIFALANFSYMFFLLKVQMGFVGQVGIAIPMLMYIIFNIIYSSGSIPFGILSDKIGRVKVITGGYLLFSLVSLGFIFFNSLIGFVILFVFYGLVSAIIDGNQRAFVSDLSSEKLRATYLGTYHTTIGLMALPAGLIAGFLWEFNPNLTFAYGLVLSLLSAVLFFIFKNYFKK